MSGFTTTGATILTQRRRASTTRCSSGASSPSGSEGWGSSSSRSPCCRAFGSAAGSSSTRRWPGPEIEPLADRIRDTARRALAPLHRAHGRAREPCSCCSASSGSTTGWGSSRRSRSRSRRCRPAASARRRPRSRLRGRDAVGRGRLHGPRRASTSRSLFRALVRAAAGERAAATRSCGSTWRSSLLALHRARRSRSGRTGSRSGEAAIRNGVFQVVSIDDDDRLRERRLHRLADVRADDARSG